MGARTVVAVSRNPGTRLDDTRRTPRGDGDDVGRRRRRRRRRGRDGALFDRFGDRPARRWRASTWPPTSGGPVTLGEMTDDDVAAMFRPKIDAVALLHQLSLRTAGAAVRAVLVDLRAAGVSLAGALRRDHHLPGHLRLRTPRRRAARHARQLGLWKSLADTQDPELERQVTLELRSGADAGRGRHPRAVVGVGPGAPARCDRRRPPTGPGWPPPTAPARALRIVDDLLPRAERHQTVLPATRNSAEHCGNASPKGAANCCSTTWPRSSRRRWDWPRRSSSIRRPDSSSSAWIR